MATQFRYTFSHPGQAIVPRSATSSENLGIYSNSIVAEADIKIEDSEVNLDLNPACIGVNIRIE